MAGHAPLRGLIRCLKEIVRRMEAASDAILDEAVAMLSMMTQKEYARLSEGLSSASGRKMAEPVASISTPPSTQHWVVAADVGHGLLADFLVESREGLERAELSLLRLERNPEDHEALHDVFRTFHTIKGASGFLGLHWVATLAHYSEDLLAHFRSGTLTFSPAMATLALSVADQLRALFAQIETAPAGVALPQQAAYALLLLRLTQAARQVEPIVSVAPVHTSSAISGGWESRKGEHVRVRLDKLDRLVDLVAELVVAQKALVDLTQRDEPVSSLVPGGKSPLCAQLHSTSRIIRDLQDVSLELRMVPLHGVFQKARLLARDVAIKSGKSLSCVTDGAEIELERSMVDRVGNSVLHMLHNAIDHGIEPPEERVRCGKSPEGTVTLCATQEDGEVVITLRDDGRGLDRDRIFARARALGLVDPEVVLTAQEIFHLICSAGFSTAEQLTCVSGRGVGMDVVRRNVDAMGGRIEIESESGQGTTFHMRLPLTLMVTDGALVRVGADRVPPGNDPADLCRPNAHEPVRREVTPLAGLPTPRARSASA
jgi:two-component system chemotaxis sensor kinase CheA